MRRTIERQPPKRQVRDALGRLYDPIYLRRHPLARQMASVAGEDLLPAAAGAALRQALLDAIENIKPAAGAAGSERIWRPYRIMELRYIEAMPPTEVQDQLGIAKTQYYLQHEDALAAVTEAFASANLGAQADDHALAAVPELPHLRVLEPEGARSEAHDRRLYLVPVANLADVKRALAAIEPVSHRQQPVVLVIERWEQIAAGGLRQVAAALA